MSSVNFINSLFSIQGKRVIITGGGRGIGLMIVDSFLKADVDMCFLISRNKKVITEVSNKLNLTYKNKKCIPIAADLSNEDHILNAVNEIKKHTSYIDVLVNNSGCNWGESIHTYPSKAWDKVLNLNVKSVFLLTRELIPLLEQNATPASPSRVINIGSVDGVRVPTLETFAYSASKAAVHQLTKVLAYHLGGKDITVNGIAAGPFPSKMMNETLENFKELILSGLVLQRVGEPNDIGGLCIYLSSNASSWMTGAIIPLDGGTLVSAKL